MLENGCLGCSWVMLIFLRLQNLHRQGYQAFRGSPINLWRIPSQEFILFIFDLYRLGLQIRVLLAGLQSFLAELSYADCNDVTCPALFASYAAQASGVSSSLGGTSCQKSGRFVSHSFRIAAPLLLPVFSFIRQACVSKP